MSFLLFFVSLFAVVKSAQIALRYAARLARAAKMTEYLIGFFVVAIISVFPETFISIMSALQNIPSFGLGTLFGSNVADLTLVFAVVALLSYKGIRVESRIIKEAPVYLGVISIPLLLGFDGVYSRLDGLVLVFLSALFYFITFKDNHRFFEPVKIPAEIHPPRPVWHHVLYLVLSLAVLLAASYTTVKFGVRSAENLGINPILIGMLVVAVGTTMPELFFSIEATLKRHYNLGLGDILGTVVTDATAIVGIVSLVKPFSFNPNLVYVTGIFMLLSAALLFYFMKSGRRLSKGEALLLLFFYLVFIWVELAVTTKG